VIGACVIIAVVLLVTGHFDVFTGHGAGTSS
jgi:hypothetical protein